jgi:hypothetical protein
LPGAAAGSYEGVTAGNPPQAPLRPRAGRQLSRLRSAGADAANGAGAAERSRAFEWLVRAGFLARGLTYGLVGALAIALAFGAGTAGTATDQQGALALVSRAPLGFIALALIAAGLLAYAVWKLTQAFNGRGPEGGGGPSLGQRLANAGGGVAYLLFCAVAVRLMVGSGGGSSSGSPQHAAGGVLGWPGGRWLVGIAGVVMIGGAIYQAYYGLSGHFTRQIKTAEMKRGQLERLRTLGKVGFSARAVVFALIGYFLVQSAVAYDPKQAVGVDGALARLHHQPLGPWLVGLVGVGLLLFGAFSLYEARYRRL